MNVARPEQSTVAEALASGRTATIWQEREIGDNLLRQIYELAKWGPTSVNSCPLRIVYIKSSSKRRQLADCVLPGNVEKVLSAPVTAILAYDSKFFEHLPTLFPHDDARSWFAGDENHVLAEVTALRNSSLQSAYFILAARSLGLDCGPMSGFDQERIDAEFLSDWGWRSNMLCCLGYADWSKLHPRGPRLDYRSVVQIS